MRNSALRVVGQAIHVVCVRSGRPAAGFQPAGPEGKHASRLSTLTVVVAFLGGGCAWAQIQQPQLGAMLTGDGSPRAVFGVTGSVTLGAAPSVGPASGSVLSILNMGCSRRLCLVKMDSALMSFPASPASPAAQVPTVFNAPAGPALFWFESSTTTGTSALVYFPRSRQLARWQNSQLSPVDFDITGDILSIGEATDGALQFAVRTPVGTWIVRNGDVLVESLDASSGSLGPPGPVSSVLLLHGGVLFGTSDGLILRRPDQSELVFKVGRTEAAEQGLTHGSTHGSTNGLTAAPEPQPSGSEVPRLEPITLSWLGENYVQVRVRGSDGDYTNYALRVDLGHERLFLLPEPEPEPQP